MCIRKGGDNRSRFPNLSRNISNVWSDKHETFVGEHIVDVISEVIGSNHVPITQSPESTSQDRDIQKEDKVIRKAESPLGDISENASSDYVNHISSIHVTSKSQLIIF